MKHKEYCTQRIEDLQNLCNTLSKVINTYQNVPKDTMVSYLRTMSAKVQELSDRISLENQD